MSQRHMLRRPLFMWCLQYEETQRTESAGCHCREALMHGTAEACCQLQINQKLSTLFSVSTDPEVPGSIPGAIRFPEK
jgi:hypothetical protein